MKHILIVDDDPVATLILKKNLELIQVNQETITFSNGEEAYAYFKKKYNEKENYYVFLDINMPLMNGWDFLNSIDSFINKANTHIYILTSSINKLDMDKATQYTLIEKYLSKPINKEVLKTIKEENKW